MKKSINEKPEPQVAARSPQSKRYEETFKKQAVEHWLQSGKPGTQIARELGVSYPTLKQWKHGCCGDAMPMRPDLESENRALRAELARVREQRDILKKRWAFDSALRPHPSGCLRQSISLRSVSLCRRGAV